MKSLFIIILLFTCKAYFYTQNIERDTIFMTYSIEYQNEFIEYYSYNTKVSSWMLNDCINGIIGEEKINSRIKDRYDGIKYISIDSLSHLYNSIINGEKFVDEIIGIGRFWKINRYNYEEGIMDSHEDYIRFENYDISYPYQHKFKNFKILYNERLMPMFKMRNTVPYDYHFYGSIFETMESLSKRQVIKLEKLLIPKESNQLDATKYIIPNSMLFQEIYNKKPIIYIQDHATQDERILFRQVSFQFNYSENCF